MNPRMITDPDHEVIDMVNASTNKHRRVAEQREILRRMNSAMEQDQKKAQRRELREMVCETGACVALAVVAYAAYWQSLMAAQLAVPIIAVSIIFAAIRVGRFFRR